MEIFIDMDDRNISSCHSDTENKGEDNINIGTTGEDIGYLFFFIISNLFLLSYFMDHIIWSFLLENPNDYVGFNFVRKKGIFSFSYLLAIYFF